MLVGVSAAIIEVTIDFLPILHDSATKALLCLLFTVRAELPLRIALVIGIHCDGRLEALANVVGRSVEVTSFIGVWPPIGPRIISASGAHTRR